MRIAHSAALALAAFGTPALAQDELLERGRYLSLIMDCGGCHTQGALIGQPDPKLDLAGSTIGFEVPGYGYVYPPNLTSDPQTGLGDEASHGSASPQTAGTTGREAHGSEPTAVTTAVCGTRCRPRSWSEWRRPWRWRAGRRIDIPSHLRRSVPSSWVWRRFSSPGAMIRGRCA